MIDALLSLSVSFLDLTHTNRCGHFSPLQDDILDDASIGVDIDALILIAQQHLHTVWAGQEHNSVRCHVALDLFWDENRRSAPVGFTSSPTTLLHNLHELGCKCHSCFRSPRRWHESQHKNRRWPSTSDPPPLSGRQGQACVAGLQKTGSEEWWG